MPDPEWTRVDLQPDDGERFAQPRRAPELPDDPPVALPVLAGILFGLVVMQAFAGWAQ